MDDLLAAEDRLPAIDPAKDYYTELVGEGRKFKTPQDLGRSKMESDHYIKTLERQKDEMRNDLLKLKEEANTRAKLEELIDQMKQSNSAPANDITEDKPGYKPEDLDSLIDTRMQARESERRSQDNFRFVQAKLKERYGNNYQEVLKERIDDLELTTDYVNNMARTTPKALLRILGADQEPVTDPFQAPPRSSRITDTFKPNVQKRTWAYYQNLKKSDYKTYSNPKTQVQMHKDYESLGSEFEDGDFKALG